MCGEKMAWIIKKRIMSKICRPGRIVKPYIQHWMGGKGGEASFLEVKLKISYYDSTLYVQLIPSKNIRPTVGFFGFFSFTKQNEVQNWKVWKSKKKREFFFENFLKNEKTQN